MERIKIKCSNLLPVVDNYLYQLLTDYQLHLRKIAEFKLEERLDLAKYFKKAQIEFLASNKEFNERKKTFEIELQIHHEAKRRLEQPPQTILEKITHPIIKPFQKNKLENVTRRLVTEQQRLQAIDKQLLETDAAKQFIKEYIRLNQRYDPAFIEYQNLKRTEKNLESKLGLIEKLRFEISEADPEKVIIIDDKLNKSCLSLQAPLIIKQLNEFKITIGELDEAVKLNLRKLGAEFEQNKTEINELSSDIVQEVIDEKETKILIKETQHKVRDIQYQLKKKDALKNNLDSSTREVLSLVTDRQFKAVQELITDKEELSKFQNECIRCINQCKWNKLPEEVQLKLRTNPQLNELKQKTMQLRNEKAILTDIAKIIDRIPDKNQVIKVKGFYLKRENLLQQEKSIKYQLRTIVNNKNLHLKSHSEKFGME